MSVKAAANHDDEVLTLHVWDAEQGRAVTEKKIDIPFTEIRKAITAMYGVYVFIDPKDARSMFRDPLTPQRQPENI